MPEFWKNFFAHMVQTLKTLKTYLVNKKVDDLKFNE